ncbi:MAG: hypothetical protein IJO43_00460 [Bacilli bacterium]|nr:hypothetical protein [Bacilli bacterium]
MEKKNNKGVVISLLIVIAVLIGSIAYMFISGIASFDIKKNNDNETEEKENNKNDILTLNLTETEKKYFMESLMPIFDEKTYTSTNYEISKLSNFDKIMFALYLEDPTNKWNDMKTNYTVDDLLEILQKYLGPGATFVPETVKCGDHYYFEYNSHNPYHNNKPTIEKDVHYHGGVEYHSDAVNQFVEGTITKKDGQIAYATVKVRKSFGDACNDECAANGRYGTVEDALNRTNLVLSIENMKDVPYSEYNNYYKKEIEQNPDAYPIHTYVFNYENGNYYLESITIEK